MSYYDKQPDWCQQCDELMAENERLSSKVDYFAQLHNEGENAIDPCPICAVNAPVLEAARELTDMIPGMVALRWNAAVFRSENDHKSAAKLDKLLAEDLNRAAQLRRKILGEEMTETND